MASDFFICQVLILDKKVPSTNGKAHFPPAVLSSPNNGNLEGGGKWEQMPHQYFSHLGLKNLRPNECSYLCNLNPS
jgi:hypothetical protein